DFLFNVQPTTIESIWSEKVVVVGTNVDVCFFCLHKTRTIFFLLSSLFCFFGESQGSGDESRIPDEGERYIDDTRIVLVNAIYRLVGDCGRRINRELLPCSQLVEYF